MIDSHRFPGPAIWQGLMLTALLPLLAAVHYKNGKYERLAIFCYFCLGFILMGIILYD